jgi:NADH-quinone oxidoreductase subunit M
MLWTLQRVYFGLDREGQAGLPDLTGQEIAVLTPLATMAILMGVLPAVFVFALSNNTLAAMFKLF